MELTVGAAREPPVEALEVEVVERKGLGHPDSICDRLAEHLSRSLSRHYLDHFGLVLHHNVDVALRLENGGRPTRFAREVETIVRGQLSRLDAIGREILEAGHAVLTSREVAVDPRSDRRRHARQVCRRIGRRVQDLTLPDA